MHKTYICMHAWYHLQRIRARGVNDMARLMELGLVLRGAEAEEFLKNEKSTAFTPEQISFFREAKRIYRSHRSTF